MFVYGDVVYAQTWEVLPVKNCVEPPQSFLVDCLLFGDFLFYETIFVYDKL